MLHTRRTLQVTVPRRHTDTGMAHLTR